MTPHVRTFIYW